MTTATRPQAWTPPRVNLLPPQIGQRRRLRRVQVAAAVLVLVAVALIGFLYWRAWGEVSQARDELEVSQAQGASLRSRTAELAHVDKVHTTVQQAERALGQATSEEIRWSYYLADLGLVLPPNVWLDSMTVYAGTPEPTATTGSTSQPAPAKGSHPAGAGATGTVTFAGSAYSHDDVATWLEVLGRQVGYADPYLTSSTERTVNGLSVVDFICQVEVTDDALWTNYRKVVGGG